jgi:hypothetical protein
MRWSASASYFIGAGAAFSFRLTGGPEREENGLGLAEMGSSFR